MLSGASLTLSFRTKSPLPRYAGIMQKSGQSLGTTRLENKEMQDGTTLT